MDNDQIEFITRNLPRCNQGQLIGLIYYIKGLVRDNDPTAILDSKREYFIREVNEGKHPADYGCGPYWRNGYFYFCDETWQEFPTKFLQYADCLRAIDMYATWLDTGREEDYPSAVNLARRNSKQDD